MASQKQEHDDLLRAMEIYQDQASRALRTLQDALIKTRRGNSLGGVPIERTGSNDSNLTGSPIPPAIFTPPSPMSRPVHTSESFSDTAIASPRPRRATNELPERQPTLTVVPEKKNVPVSLYEAELDDDANVPFIPLLPPPQSPRPADENVPMVRRLLPSREYDDEDLIPHIRRMDEDQTATVTALDHVWKNRNELNVKTLFENVSGEEDIYAKNATYEVYDIGLDGHAIQRHDSRANADHVVLESSTVWETLKARIPTVIAISTQC